MAMVLMACAVTFVRWFAVTPFSVSGSSMEPTAGPGQSVLVDRLTWHWHGLSRGDVVVVRSPQDGERLLKRVVGLAGDEVRIDDSVLVVNGSAVTEPYVDRSRIDGTYFGPAQVPSGHVFVLGDNRFGSIDSRVFGAVAESAVQGRLLTVLP
jgi:signal peptidase I